MDHLDKHSSLNHFQHGFRQKRSCKTQLVTTVRDFADCLNRKGQIDAVLLDFSKAFDKVDHEKLLTKLHSLGIGILTPPMDTVVHFQPHPVVAFGPCKW